MFVNISIYICTVQYGSNTPPAGAPASRILGFAVLQVDQLSNRPADGLPSASELHGTHQSIAADLCFCHHAKRPLPPRNVEIPDQHNISSLEVASHQSPAGSVLERLYVFPQPSLPKHVGYVLRATPPACCIVVVGSEISHG